MALGLFLAGSSLLFAEDTKRQSIEELLRVCRFEEYMHHFTDHLVDSTKQMNPDAARYENELREFYQNCISVDVLREETIKTYGEVFSEEEIRDITAFYRTSTGQKAIVKMPEIMQKTMGIASCRVGESLADFEKMVAEKDRLEVQSSEGKTLSQE